MANRRKVWYIAGFIAICWTAWAGLIGIFNVLAHFLKSSTAAVTLFLVILYSFLFGVFGWLVYTWKGRRDGWPAADTRGRRRAKDRAAKVKASDNAEGDQCGWKRILTAKGKGRE